MKDKNIVIVICIAASILSNTYSMQIINKRFQPQHYFNQINSTIQKRNIETSGQIIAEGLIAWGVIYGIMRLSINAFQSYLLEHRSHKIQKNKTRYFSNEIIEIGNYDCSLAYINQEKCQNIYCCKSLYPYNSNHSSKKDIRIEKLNLFNKIPHKLTFLIKIKYNLQDLRNKEEEIELLCAEGTFNRIKSNRLLAMIQHKKECHRQQITLFQECINNYSQALDTEHNKLLNILKTLVEEEKKTRDKEFIEKIKTVSIMRTGENDRDYVQSCNQPQLIEKYTRADKIDHNWRNDDSSTQNLNMLIMNAYTAKLIYDITTHNHASQNSQIESYSPSFSSDSSYTDNSSSSDNNTSSPNHE